MAASPLIWMELTGLDREDAKRLSRIIGVYKEHRGAFAQSHTIPIGNPPDGGQFTGFQIRTDERSGYLILLREFCKKDTGTYTLDCLPDCELTLTALCANCDAPDAQTLPVSPDGQIRVAIGKPFGYLFAKYECSK